MFRFMRPRELRKLGVLGMNRRNNHYISRHNPRRLYPLVDDKLRTKHTAEYWGMSVPELYGVVESQRQVSDLADVLNRLESFVIKPAQGSGGKGILVVVDRDEKGFYKPNGQHLSLADLQRHVSNILSGLHSLGGRLDTAIIETLVEFDDVFSAYSYQGVPDVRIIVYRGVPVMAMLRCPTQASDGKANLHQGAVGVGLDIASGRGLQAVQHNQRVLQHPDTGNSFEELQVPQWPRILEIGAGCADMTGLGYLGADIVLDRSRGPLLLELNARPGLSIQIANGGGLLARLRAVETHHSELSLQERIQFACLRFGRFVLEEDEPSPQNDP